MLTMTPALVRIAVAAGALVLTAPVLAVAAPAQPAAPAPRQCVPATYESRIRSVSAVEVPRLTGRRTIEYRKRTLVKSVTVPRRRTLRATAEYSRPVAVSRSTMLHKVVDKAMPENLEGTYRARVGDTSRESMVAPGPLPVQRGSKVVWYVGRIVIAGRFTYTWCAPGIVANTGFIATAKGRFRSYGTHEAGYVQCGSIRDLQSAVAKRALRFGC